MPIDYKEYHPKWSLISRLIRFFRAGNKCEICGLENGAIIKRLGKGQWREPNEEEDSRLCDLMESGLNYQKALKEVKLTKIILTVAHMDHIKTNNRFDNLKALCQSCHLFHDKDHHATNRRFGRNWKKNQTELGL